MAHPMLAPVYELADGDMVFFTEILESMTSSIPEDVAEIEKGIENKQISIVGRSAHHMKSSIMYSNAEELKEMLSVIEIKKEASAIDEVKALMPRLKLLAKELTDIIDSEKKK
jgi:HPt (histidine-containing phosphotransfer) domain-containing protein